MADSNKSDRNLSFMRRAWIFLVSVIAVIALMAMILCAINPVISPKYFPWTSFFGLTFWPLLFINIVIFIVLLFLKSRKSLIIPALALVIAIPGFLKSYSLIRHGTVDGDFTVMSYNIGNFMDIKDKTRKKTETISDYILLIKKYNPDIVGLQESGAWTDKTAKDFASKIDFPYYYFNNKHYTGNIIFSKYPLQTVDFAIDMIENNTIGFILKADAGKKGSFYIGCVHLTSFNITSQEIAYINDAKNFVEDSEIYGKSLINKLKAGFERRTDDTKTILSNLPKDETPLLIIGDFNDTPLSYTYQRMKSTKLKDSFLECGSGIGVTYSGSLPLLRIDYMWHNAKIVPMSFERINEKISDHYPIMMSFNITD